MNFCLKFKMKVAATAKSLNSLKLLYCFGLARCDGALPQVSVRLAAAFFSSEDRDA